MPARSLRRGATSVGYATPTAAPVYVDSDDNKLKFIPAGSGTTEVEVVDASSSQTLTNKTLTSPTLTSPTISGAVVTETVEVVTTTNVIAASETGKTFFLNAAAGFVSTLPAPAAGLRFRFVVGVTPPTSGNHTVVTTSNATIIQGNIATVPVDDAGVRGDNEDTISFVASVALEGDYVDVVSDGTNWYVSGLANVVEAITLTDA